MRCREAGALGEVSQPRPGLMGAMAYLSWAYIMSRAVPACIHHLSWHHRMASFLPFFLPSSLLTELLGKTTKICRILMSL